MSVQTKQKNHYALKAIGGAAISAVVFMAGMTITAHWFGWNIQQQLERRRTWKNTVERNDNQNPLYIPLTLLALIICVALCVMSHPQGE